MSLKPLSPQAAQALLNQGAVLVDIRGADEHARERIARARHVPMDRLQGGGLSVDGATAVIFHCRSGNRTQVNAPTLAACAACDAYVLEGGLDAWKKAGLPVVTDASQPLELQRQVQIAAGSLIVIGAVLGATVSPWFHALSGFVGAGLVFAGASGFCGLARVLMRMPWNRRALA
ncbi:rhodanese family protein [Hydrogenophaga palleronii]|uniref:rhodanese family protein n=1 Tax=Hydrogenophaga palleronii TaxID=65655 RepID=UPI000825E612|nr:rhodanese family protein [Hydrogenophaga palleronii]